jgi:hypothetical protein
MEDGEEHDQSPNETYAASIHKFKELKKDASGDEPPSNMIECKHSTTHEVKSGSDYQRNISDISSDW